MNESIWIGAAFAFGAVLATAYLGALWSTVKRIRTSTAPMRWLVTSVISRMAILFIAFFFLIVISDGELKRLMAAVAGFIVVRTAALGCMRGSRST